MISLYQILNQPDNNMLKLYGADSLWVQIKEVDGTTARPEHFDLDIIVDQDSLKKGDIVHIDEPVQAGASSIRPVNYHPNPKDLGSIIEISGRIAGLRQHKERTFIDLQTGKNIFPVVVEGSYYPDGDLPELHIGRMLNLKGSLTKRWGKSKRNIPFEILLTNPQDHHVEQYGNYDGKALSTQGKPEEAIKISNNNDPAEITMRNRYMQATHSIGSSIIQHFESHFRKKGFTRYSATTFLTGNAEGGAEPFKLEGYDVQLAQSPQLEKEIMAIALGPVYTVTPAFRNDPSSTRVHLPEFTGLDVEIPVFDVRKDVMAEIMKHLEGFVSTLYSYLSEAKQDDLALLGVRLPQSSMHFPVYEFSDAINQVKDYVSAALRKNRVNKGVIAEAIRELKASGQGVSLSDENILEHVLGKDSKDLSPKSEQVLIDLASRDTGFPAVFVYNFPLESKPFYVQPQGREGSRSFDLLVGKREISSGGERIYQEKTVVQGLKRKGMWDGKGKVPAGVTRYYNTIVAGSPRHGGFGIGYERLLYMVLDGKVHARYLKPFVPYPMQNYVSESRR